MEKEKKKNNDRSTYYQLGSARDWHRLGQLDFLIDVYR